MTDIMAPERRSALMARIRGRDTTPEMVVRRLLHAMGYRFRLHGKELPGRPDIVFSRRKSVIFVHGCFWHRHGCPETAVPKSRPEFWEKKFAGNLERDRRNLERLGGMGWQCLVVWECEMKDPAKLARLLVEFLGPPAAVSTPASKLPEN